MAVKAGFAVGLKSNLLGAEQVAHGVFELGLLQTILSSLVLLLEFCLSVGWSVLVLADVATLSAIAAYELLPV